MGKNTSGRRTRCWLYRDCEKRKGLSISICMHPGVCHMMYLVCLSNIKKQMDTENKCINSDGCLMLFQK